MRAIRRILLIGLCDFGDGLQAIVARSLSAGTIGAVRVHQWRTSDGRRVAHRQV